MDWNQLKQNKCPYCRSILVFDDDNEINCTNCVFHISPQKYKAILENRTDKTKKVYRLHWQNLRVGRCPICNDELRDAVGKYEITECVKYPECSFKIRNDKMEMILSDPLHPAHQFDYYDNPKQK